MYLLEPLLIIFQAANSGMAVIKNWNRWFTRKSSDSNVYLDHVTNVHVVSSIKLVNYSKIVYFNFERGDILLTACNRITHVSRSSDENTLKRSYPEEIAQPYYFRFGVADDLAGYDDGVSFDCLCG